MFPFNPLEKSQQSLLLKKPCLNDGWASISIGIRPVRRRFFLFSPIRGGHASLRGWGGFCTRGRCTNFIKSIYLSVIFKKGVVEKRSCSALPISYYTFHLIEPRFLYKKTGFAIFSALLSIETNRLRNATCYLDGLLNGCQKYNHCKLTGRYKSICQPV